jgi:hypothetical protein
MAKIQMNSVSMALQQSIGLSLCVSALDLSVSLASAAMIKVQGCISASVDVMRAMNRLRVSVYPRLISRQYDAIA